MLQSVGNPIADRRFYSPHSFQCLIQTQRNYHLRREKFRYESNLALTNAVIKYIDMNQLFAEFQIVQSVAKKNPVITMEAASKSETSRRLSLRSQHVFGKKVNTPESGLQTINEDQLLPSKHQEEAAIRFEAIADMRLNMEYEELRRRAMKVHYDTLYEICEIYKCHLLEEQKTLDMAYGCLVKLSNADGSEQRSPTMGKRLFEVLMGFLVIVVAIALAIFYPGPIILGETCVKGLFDALLLVLIPVLSTLFPFILF